MYSQAETENSPLFRNKKVKRRCHFLMQTPLLFYYCVLISSWDDRSWFFLVGIYLVALDPSNLILTAIFGLLSSGVVLLLGSWVGSWVDRTSRLKAAYVALIIRNVSTLICSVVLCLVFVYYDEVVLSNDHPVLLILAKVGLIVFGISAHLGAMTNDNMLTKDWVAILCDGDSHVLSKMTARFRLIDLVSKVIAPIIIGQIMTFTSKAVAAIVFSVQVMLTLILFCFLLRVIYRRMPRLHYRGEYPLKSEGTTFHNVSFENKKEEPEVKLKKGALSVIAHECWSLVEGWYVYFSERVRFAGLGLALLYMTVLGFDTVTIGYALSQGMSEFVLSLFNAGSALTGIFGAILFPYVLTCTNIVYTGIIAITLQFVCLTPCIVSVWIPSILTNTTHTPMDLITVTNLTTSVSTVTNTTNLSLYMLMGGIVASRVGLWMFDLTVTQLLIETVSEINRGKVNGVQNALNMLFDMIKFGLVLGLPYPYQFWILILISVGAVLAGSVLYMVFAVINRCRVIIKL